MPAQLIDSFDATAPWSARTPGAAPSAEIPFFSDPDLPPAASGTASLRFEPSAASDGHFLTRTIAPTDLTAFPDLVLWHRSAAKATGAVTAPFQVRLELGSPALPAGAVGNDWHRYLHISNTGSWEHQRIALDDLAPAVRSAVDTIVLRMAIAGTGAPLWVEGLYASDPGIAQDADAALLAALNAQLDLNGASVPAAIDVPGLAPLTAPWIRLVQYDAVYAGKRAGAAQRKTDFTDDGHRLRDGAEPWDLYYRIDCVAANRPDQAAMVDFILSRLGLFSRIAAGGRVMRVERVPNVHPDDALSAGPLLRYRVQTWAEPNESRPVMPVSEVSLDLDQTGAA